MLFPHVSQMEVHTIKKKSSSCLIKSGWLVSALAILGSVAVFVTVGVYLPQKNTPSDLSKLCLRCHELKTTLYDDESSRPLFEDLRVENDNGVKMCCADNGGQVSAMLELISKKQQSPAYDRAPLTASKSLNFSSVYAHKLLKPNHGYKERPQGQRPRFGKPGYPILLAVNSSYTDIRYELSQGVELLPTGIKIVYPALYFVYHSVFFVTDDDYPCRMLATNTFMSLLIRNSTTSGQCKVLLRCEHTCCPGCKRNKESAFTAGQFHLDPGDVLQVEVSTVDLVQFDQHSTYLGLTMLGKVEG